MMRQSSPDVEKEGQEQPVERQPGPLEGFNLVGIVKETGVDDEGLHEFATEYFPGYPIYKDQNKVFYTALGSGKMSIGFNPLNLIKLFKDSQKRIKELGVTNYNMKGEGLVQGGWILFGKNGDPKAAFQENAKVRIPKEDIVKEVAKIRESDGES